MPSLIVLHFMYQGRIFLLTPELADSACLASQFALGTSLSAAGVTDALPTQILCGL